jgi:predicted acylesterase/phospholipase RssA
MNEIPELRSDFCPYQGLEHFTEADKDYFVGRDSETRWIASNLLGVPLSVMYGFSGVGKSSILLAGVVPRLKKNPRMVVITFREWQGEQFAQQLKLAIADVVRLKVDQTKPLDLAKRLDLASPLDEFLHQCNEALDGPVFLIFDQWEEYFLYHPIESDFDKELAVAIGRNNVSAHFLFSMREEELSKLDRFRTSIPNVLGNMLRVKPLDRKAATDAIKKPLEVFNNRIQLVRKLKSAYDESGNLNSRMKIMDPVLDKEAFEMIKGEKESLDAECRKLMRALGVQNLSKFVEAYPEYKTNFVGIEETLVNYILETSERKNDDKYPQKGSGHQKSEIEIVTPFLQLLLKEVWETERVERSKMLRLDTLKEKLGGAQNVIDNYFASAMDALPAARRDLAARIFKYLVLPGGGKIAQTPATLANWADAGEVEVQNLLEALSNRNNDRSETLPNQSNVRILRKMARGNQFEIFHDILGISIQRWLEKYKNELTKSASEIQQTKKPVSILDIYFQKWLEKYKNKLAQIASEIQQTKKPVSESERNFLEKTSDLTSSQTKTTTRPRSLIENAPLLISQARDVLSGQAIEPHALFRLAKALRSANEFGYARKLLDRARKMQDAQWPPDERLQLAQQHALTTYKDPDLPSDQKFTRALAILQEEEDLKTTTNQETLGLAGAIYKRLWEVEGNRRYLERSLSFYQRHCEAGIVADPKQNPGYTAINAAFALDLLASLEEEAGEEDTFRPDSVIARRNKAADLRKKIIITLGPPALDRAQLGNDWWTQVTLAEAHFGLGEYEKAGEWLQRALVIEGIPEWHYQTTAQQFAKLAQLRQKSLDTPEQAQAARHTLEEFLRGYGIHNTKAAVDSSYIGKVGLALSGGGFRASLFHIGVLAKLADIGVLNHVEALSCVSGGSIIGAHYYLELRRLFQEKGSDSEFTTPDYLSIVKNLEEEFLAGVQKNIRTRVISSLWSNVRMIFSSTYSRTMRVGELYEKHIYSRVKDGQDNRERWLDELKIVPMDEDHDSFKPKYDNWRRLNKAPILILNATSLNTGHVWQFTATYMGEPPAAINTEIDASYRLRRMWYRDAPPAYRDNEDASRRIRLGYAVASSSCVPGMFEPLLLPRLYKDKTVQLVDGGVFDNQGVASLLEQGCSVLLVSDASGQMTTEDNPSKSLINVLMRSTSISQERVRWAQYRELEARRRSGLLQGLMFIHLKKDLDANPVDWIDCPDPYDSTADARPPELRGPLTRYGVRKDIQQLLSGVRTDLDSFSEGEAYALMASGYFLAEHEFAKLITVFPGVTDADIRRRSSWRFLDYEQSLKQPGRGERLKELLTAASQSGFKIWRLSYPLKTLRAYGATIVLAALAASLLWVIRNPHQLPPDLWERKLFSLTIGESIGSLTLRLGWLATLLLTLLVGRIFGSKVMKIANWRETLTRWATGLGMGTLGALIAGAHLWIFDKWYLRWGKTHRLIEQEPKQK